MAFSAASCLAPAERITWSTVGSAVGMAAMARAMAVMNRLSALWPRESPSTNMRIIVPRAAAPIHRVMVLSWRVSGVCSLAVAASMPAILPTSASAPRAVTIIMPLPCVTGVFMNAMLVRSPGPRSASASASVVLDAGTLSPVSADSSMSSECASMILPSAATSSPASSMTTSPATTSSAGISASAPSRRTRAVCFISDLSAFIALSALPSWRRPDTALNTVSAMSTRPVLHWPMTSEITAAISRMICM